MSIGFFDSGIGGITVLHKALKLIPKEKYIYYADESNTPYGTKSKEQVKRLVLEAVDFLAREGIKVLVVACNTATSIAIADLRQKYNFPILGMEPAVKPAVEKKCLKRILVTATPLTLQEEKYQNLISRLGHANIVDGIALPELVEYAEKFIFDQTVILAYLKKKLADYDLSAYGTVVMGCTHFPFYVDCFRKLFPRDTDIIDGSTGTVNHLHKILRENNLAAGNANGEITFFTSGKREQSSSRYQKYLQILDSTGN